MSIDLKKLAKKSVTLGRIMSEKTEKIDTMDIIKYHKDGITINDYETVIMGEDEAVTVYTFAEEPNAFAFAGYILKKMLINMECELGAEKLLEELHTQGLKVKLSRAKTKDGKKELTKVEIL